MEPTPKLLSMTTAPGQTDEPRTPKDFPMMRHQQGGEMEESARGPGEIATASPFLRPDRALDVASRP
jgi:hypothetical protein